jgi:hypothetical protein
MFLWHVFLVRPFAALAVLTCLAAILSCWSLARKRTQTNFDRFLIGFVGLLAVYQGVRLLRDCGFLSLPSNAYLNDAVELVIDVFYLMATLMLRFAGEKRKNADFAFRLTSAAPPKPTPAIDSHEHDLATTLTWALTRLSDGAFKLFTYLYLHADRTSGQATVNKQDLLLSCGRTDADVTEHFHELQALGTSILSSENDITVVQVGSPVPSGELQQPKT